MNSNIQEMKKKRFLFLNKLYEITGGDQYHDVNMDDIGKEYGYSPQESLLIAQYLAGEGLISFETYGGGIAITHYGVVQVEDAVANPEQPTMYFPPVNIININQMTGSQIQQGTSQSNQMMTVTTVDLEAISKFISELKNNLPDLQLATDKQEEAEAEVATIEAQLKSPKPKHSILKECLKSIRSILENAAGQMAAILLLGMFPKY